MSDMKLIMESWENFVTETAEEEEAAQGTTWLSLKNSIEAAKEMAAGEITAERKAELLKILGSVGFALAATLATGPLAAAMAAVGTSATVGGAVAKMFRMYAQQPDVETKDNPVLALFNLDDGFEELIDDKLEDAFVKHIMPKIEKMAQAAPDEPIEDMDKAVNLWLSKQDLGGSTGNIAAKTNAG
jgi:hypothetical protein